jgi:hypothetical protein
VSEFGGGGGAVTDKIRAAVWDSDPAIPLTVIGYDPAGVDAEDESVRVEVHSGLHDDAANAAVVPGGTPETERETDRVLPEVRATVT